MDRPLLPFAFDSVSDPAHGEGEKPDDLAAGEGMDELADLAPVVSESEGLRLKKWFEKADRLPLVVPLPMMDEVETERESSGKPEVRSGLGEVGPDGPEGESDGVTLRRAAHPPR